MARVRARRDASAKGREPPGIRMPGWAIQGWLTMTAEGNPDAHPLCPRYEPDGYLLLPEAGMVSTDEEGASSFVVVVILLRLNPLRVVRGFEAWGRGATLEAASALAFTDAHAALARRRDTYRARRAFSARQSSVG